MRARRSILGQLVLRILGQLVLPVLLVSPLALAMVACEGHGAESVVPRAQQASAPATGKADSNDASDQACQVVLRTLGRQPGDGDFETACVDNVCTYVWRGQVDVDAKVAPPAKVGVLYRRAGEAWWQVDGTLSSTVSPGYARYDVAISEHLPGPASRLAGPAASAAELAALRVDVIPFVQLADGSRLFDHNRLPGAFDNYALDAQNNFAVGDAPSVCAPVHGRISFFANWDEHQQGELRQGGYLVVDYDLARLPQCRATHNGYPAWDTIAYVRFSPGGQLVSGSVRTFQTNHGTPINVADRRELVVAIPPDATSAAIWFKNESGAGNTCETWDSNLGANYSYAVQPAASHPRCKNVQRWAAVASDMPYASNAACLEYDVSHNVAAQHCELHLSGIGHGYMGHYGIPNRWVEAYVTVGPQQGTLVGLGMWTRYRDKDTGATAERFTLGREVSANVWQTGLITLRAGYMGGGGFAYDVEQLAFFVDVRRPTGAVVRLWQSREGANYRMTDAFGLPTSTTYIPYGNVQYADPAAAIFDLQRSCTK